MTATIETFLKVQRVLQNIDSEFPLQYAICLGEIAREEGLSLTALSQKTAMPLSTISRIVGALSKNRQKGKPYGLVKVNISKQERRRKEIYLTQNGHKLIDELLAAIETP